ncbi:hypothetical protein [Dolichospermum compactum]|nr:hypothetical protein [Dolichospermum compactum]
MNSQGIAWSINILRLVCNSCSLLIFQSVFSFADWGLAIADGEND